MSWKGLVCTRVLRRTLPQLVLLVKEIKSRGIMNILPKKSWHVRNKDNVARVRRDEARAAEEEQELRRRVERAEQEARTELLRRKSRAALPQGEEGHEGQAPLVGHLDLFPPEEGAEKRGNEEYLREKREEKERQERAIGLLVSLGPAPGSEATPWYLERRVGAEPGEELGAGRGEGEREKKDRRLKAALDPLRDVDRALQTKSRRVERKRSRKREREQEEGGQSSLDRLREERVRREAEERRRARALLASRAEGERSAAQEPDERDRPYNSQYCPQLARRPRRRDGDLGPL
ncbi:leukocyte receptor cluster member 1 [Lepisosteus oculatus]|uniref:leukocyte receptor cluster member 1 n=1 Tax=Lepisosteus oculatus TaxID=7918 RepID=UPI0035F500D3